LARHKKVLYSSNRIPFRGNSSIPKANEEKGIGKNDEVS
jgi:hypothetical protein